MINDMNRMRNRLTKCHVCGDVTYSCFGTCRCCWLTEMGREPRS